ncbi:SPOR and LysM peptidoglycan-binding domain-containing protein [Psychrobacter frigidicola]|uniref:SPOR and LysM peptidoglycan-binding domain-containing protein n=1 Tax=Psychrobacter frigidicola TaxID=45611 RepID=UPI00191ABC54|nr:LysM peptidoglycan-binding domain-containing protein [Psychrobacter frigidicola]
MNFSRQALLGIGMIIGGIVMLSALAQQLSAGDEAAPKIAIVAKPSPEQATAQPLTIDIDTEKRILAQKQKERASRTAEQEKRAELFLEEQESAEAQALSKARNENQQYTENIASTGGDSDSPEAAQSKTATPIATPKIQPRVDNTVKPAVSTASDKQKAARAKKKAEAQAAAKQKKKDEEKAASKEIKKSPPKAPIDYTIKSGDGLLKLARQYNVSVAALAQANNIAPSTILQIGQVLTVPSRKQIERLEREAAAVEKVREEKRKKEEALARKSDDAKRNAQQKLSEARKEVKATDAKGSFGVQVALASNQASADEVAKKFKAAGYQVKTSQTSRGVRVVVGPERGKIAALALKDKVNSDPEVNTTSAWVLYWR